MRKSGFWPNLVALFALMMGFVPSGAIASLLVTNCKMACCAGQQAHTMADPVCEKECDSAKGSHSSPASELQEKQAGGCKCSVSSVPTAPQPDIAATAASWSFHNVAADVARDVELVPTFVESESKAGIFGSDSGPPASRPNHAFSGRAPPVHLA